MFRARLTHEQNAALLAAADSANEFDEAADDTEDADINVDAEQLQELASAYLFLFGVAREAGLIIPPPTREQRLRSIR